jgi:hypothetical protein
MRKRGLIIFLVSLLCWTVLIVWIRAKIPPDVKLEPPPLLFEIGWAPFVLSVAGICVSVFDFISWIKRGVWKPSN